MSILRDAQEIYKAALLAAQPDTAVQNALNQLVINPGGKLVVVSLGKAAWQMAKAASDALGERINQGIVITKYEHGKGDIPGFVIREAGHPVPDDNSFLATAEAIDLVSALKAQDTVLLLISGGGSALFEQPKIPGKELQDITQQLLAKGLDITQMNTIRKRLSRVKGGRFAQLCQPARVYAIVLSDIIGDPLDMIASGPAFPDSSTCGEAQALVEEYQLQLSPQATACLAEETPKELPGVESLITGSVSVLCKAAAEAATKLGYEPLILTDSLSCQAKEAGSFLGSMARYHQDTQHSAAFIAGGETVVMLTGKGMGGRNQELALSAAKQIAGLANTCVFSLGSDGTDGPTDAAGGIVFADTADKLAQLGIQIDQVLRDNDSYHALEKVEGLIITGPTGTNVNDLSVVLIKR